jgi:cytochrome bd-type quinol oxidase subunit 2
VLWLLSRPLCWFVDVQSVNPGSQACPAVIPEAVLTVRVLGLLVVVVVGAVVLGREVLALTREDAQHGDSHAIRRILIASVGVAFGFALAALLPDTAILTLSDVPVEPIAVLVGIPLSYIAAQVLGARDARRFVLGAFVAMAGWLVVVYPNIAALPLPSAVVNAYQGLLPTYLYAFQFPVSTAERNVATPLLSPTLAILTIAIAVSCLVVAYSAWLWRIALAESAASTASPGVDMSDDPSEGLARTGGGA